MRDGMTEGGTARTTARAKARHNRRVRADVPVSGYTTREVGIRGEELAAEYLQGIGVEIVERNWRCPYGEVDIVGKEGDVALLIEVKTRLRHGDGAAPFPEVAVDERKRNRYRLLGSIYLVEHPRIASVRFDVVSVELVDGDEPLITYYLNAFQSDE